MIGDLLNFPFVGQQMVQECTLPSIESKEASQYLFKISVSILFIAEFVFISSALNCLKIIPCIDMVFKIPIVEGVKLFSNIKGNKAANEEILSCSVIFNLDFQIIKSSSVCDLPVIIKQNNNHFVSSSFAHKRMIVGCHACFKLNPI